MNIHTLRAKVWDPEFKPQPLSDDLRALYRAKIEDISGMPSPSPEELLDQAFLTCRLTLEAQKPETRVSGLVQLYGRVAELIWACSTKDFGGELPGFMRKPVRKYSELRNDFNLCCQKLGETMVHMEQLNLAAKGAVDSLQEDLRAARRKIDELEQTQQELVATCDELERKCCGELVST